MFANRWRACVDRVFALENETATCCVKKSVIANTTGDAEKILGNASATDAAANESATATGRGILWAILYSEIVRKALEEYQQGQRTVERALTDRHGFAPASAQHVAAPVEAVNFSASAFRVGAPGRSAEVLFSV